jgi:hypothetical protein
MSAGVVKTGPVMYKSVISSAKGKKRACCGKWNIHKQ